MHIYLDNAATTPLAPEVLEEMLPYMTTYFGNPSSIHSRGRETRSAIEKARRTIAALLNTSPSEIFFTSGGTEADNMALQSSIKTLGIRNVVTTPIEHHAVLHTLEAMEKAGEIKLSLLPLDSKGRLNEEDLAAYLEKNPNALVSIMHANNEVGNINNIESIGEICKRHNAVFHSDTVQTMGHFVHDLQKININFIVGSAHKFHGPKGVGFIYINGDTKIQPFINGGAQERNMRGGTENVYGIIGMAKALEMAYANMEKDKEYISSLKFRLIDLLKAKIQGVEFNGDCLNKEASLYTVVNASMPRHEINEMILFNMDIQKIAVSGGSACASGTDIGSHVLQFLKVDHERGHIRFSFSKYNTAEEVEHVVNILESLYKK